MVVLKQLGAGPELFHCHVTLILETLIFKIFISMGVGGTKVTEWRLQTTLNRGEVM